jgi:hypothetical protein
MHATKVPARAALAWMAGGGALLKRERERWLGGALVYLIGAALLHRIPFLGDLALILLTPLALGSLLLLAEHGHAPAAVALERANWRALLNAYLVQPARALARIFRDEQRRLPALMLGILVLGGIVAAQIVAYLLVGGSPVSGLNAASFAVAGRAGLLVALLLVVLLYLLLTMALFYSVPLCVLHGLTPPAALFESFRAGARNAVPLALFTAVFFLPYVLIAKAFQITRWLGYPLLFTLGTVTLALFLAAAYRSYQALYGPRSPLA